MKKREVDGTYSGKPLSTGLNLGVRYAELDRLNHVAQN